MLIGIMSDSHDHHLAVREALVQFDKLSVEHIVHCGDVGGQGVFDELVGRPLTFVWGNTDHHLDYLCTYLESVDLPVPTEIPTGIKLGGKRFAVFHGHERGFENAAFALDVDYILHGHSHVARDETLNGIRIINPGALHRARPKTVATLDTSTDELTFYEMDGS
ncbi:MAG: YfcE family phosphodiesterase [Planctomycetes bacterium]|nr:YfcE family phosphodiesterase [Planctomycetota bacterium]